MACHTKDFPGDTGVAASAILAHDVGDNTTDQDTPEFDLELTMSEPANGDGDGVTEAGEYYEEGEAPIVTIVITDPETGEPIDHTTVVKDSSSESCSNGSTSWEEGDDCYGDRDGLFATASLFVHGPRANRQPVLTNTARVELIASSAEPYNLSTLTTSSKLDLVVDSGEPVGPWNGSITVYLLSTTAPYTPCTFYDSSGDATTTAATAESIADCLNSNQFFAARAIAYVHYAYKADASGAKETSGKLAIRSRNLGNVYTIKTSGTTTADLGYLLFSGTSAYYSSSTWLTQSISSSTPSNSFYKASSTSFASSDQQVTWYEDRIEYQLDPVDDLEPGTYVAKLEVADRGNVSYTDYKTPGVVKVTFQVKTPDKEPFVARNCNSCHQNAEGEGFILDQRRHHKEFGDDALDGCGNCHDYQPQTVKGSSTTWTAAVNWQNAWTGAKPMSRRVHAIHFGSSLNYPTETVGYVDPMYGRWWSITLPQDVRYCEACHTEETSGTWATKPAAIPCYGCHDSDEAVGHIESMVGDITPDDPFNGDEEEGCPLCHAP